MSSGTAAGAVGQGRGAPDPLPGRNARVLPSQDPGFAAGEVNVDGRCGLETGWFQPML